MQKAPKPISQGERDAYIDGLLANVLGDLLDNKPVVAFNRIKAIREFMESTRAKG